MVQTLSGNHGILDSDFARLCELQPQGKGSKTSTRTGNVAGIHPGSRGVLVWWKTPTREVTTQRVQYRTNHTGAVRAAQPCKREGESMVDRRVQSSRLAGERRGWGRAVGRRELSKRLQPRLLLARRVAHA